MERGKRKVAGGHRGLFICLRGYNELYIHSNQQWMKRPSFDAHLWRFSASTRAMKQLHYFCGKAELYYRL